MSIPTVTIGAATKKSDYDKAIALIQKGDCVDGSSAGATLTTADFGRTYWTNSASNRTFYLPSVDSSHVGAFFTFVKLGAGNLVIDAADSDFINDSAAGGTLTGNVAAETWAYVTIRLMAADRWVIVEGCGTWATS